ncbi:DUF4034 domain-containing protein [Uliginosibacterium gangwonense]|uniref:DUF4034 domain-containing protein n=1 Tax=Uliginosibacterium gangwonense TaxID=392736 RepID=UPI0003AB3457|nr:DUF4034 domain-containing protein [Uliginosibacterium gangwonense]
MEKRFYALCFAAMLTATSAWADTPHASIDALTKIISSTPEKVLVEVECSSDSSFGNLTIGGYAKSEDGVAHSYGYVPVHVPPGNHVKVIVSLQRPPYHTAKRTNLVYLFMYANGGNTMLSRVFPLAYDWASTNSDTAVATDLRPEAVDPTRQQEMYEAISNNLLEREFNILDQQINTLISSREFGESGNQLAGAFFDAIVDLSSTQRRQLSELIRDWRASNPKSVGAVIAQAILWQKEAWVLRGGEHTPYDDPDAERLFKDRLRKAKKLLTSSKPFAGNTALWYQAAIAVADANGESNTEINKLFAEGVKKFPDYLGLYIQMAYHWSPTYGRSNWVEVEKLASLAVENTKKQNKTGSYATFYNSLESHQTTEFDLFRHSYATWPKMKLAVEDLIQQYPKGKLQKNWLAIYACRSNDQPVFLQAWGALTGNLLKREWPSNYSPEMCNTKFARKLQTGR